MSNKYANYDVEKAIVSLTEKQKQYYSKIKGKSCSIEEYFLLLADCMRKEMQTTDIAKIFGKTPNAILNTLKKIGWNRTRSETQSLISKNTDRTKKIISSNKKQSINKRGTSNLEEYVRLKIDSELYDSGLKYIVGINNNSLIDGKLEVDIPVIVLKDTGIYIFGIEVCGEYWHKIKHIDKNKKSEFKIFEIWQYINSKDQEEYGSIDGQIKHIIEEIVESVNTYS